MAGKGKKGGREMAFLLGGFTEEGQGPKFMGPYPINEELINDPSFMDFARAAGPFMMPGIYQKDYDLTVSTAYKLKESGNESFRNGDFEVAATKYRYSLQLFQYAVQVYPYVSSEMVLLNSNLSAAHAKQQQYGKALEYARACVELDSHFIKGYYRRAEAFKGLGHIIKDSGRDPTSSYGEAFKDYCKCYRKMTEEKDRVARVKQYCEALILAIDLNATKMLPDFHKEDRASICTQLISHLMSNCLPDQAKKCVNFLLITKPGYDKSGLALRYPCDVSSVSVCSFYSMSLLNSSVLTVLVHLNLQVNASDITQLAHDCKNDEFDLFQKLVITCVKRSKLKYDFSDALEKAAITNKSNFACFLLKLGAKPSKIAAPLLFDLLKSERSLLKTILDSCSPDVRAELVVKGLVSNDVNLLLDAVESGRINSTSIDLSKVMSSKILVENLHYIPKLIQTGACPDGVDGSTSPIVSVFAENHLSRHCQVDIVCILLENGAAVNNLSNAFTDPMSPVHVATKLALETENIKILVLTCSRFEFPSNGRLVDKHNRTPLHVVMITDPSSFSLEVLQHLLQFNIDTTIKDDQGKKAEDYAKPDVDDKRRTLVINHSEALKERISDESFEKDSVMFNVKSKPQLEEKSRAKNRREMDIDEEFDIIEYERLLRRHEKWQSRYEHMPKLMRMGLAKMAGGHFGCDMTVFPPNTPYTKAVDEARSERDHANHLFRDKKYSESLSIYGKSHMKFDWICANFPHKIPEIEDDIKLLVFNMAIGYYESDVPEGTVECANDAIDIDPTFYQAYHKRAEAYRQIAAHRRPPGKPTYPIDCLRHAVTDYACAYKYCTSSDELDMRAEWFCECLVIAIEIGSTNHLPSIHEADEPLLLTKVVEHLVKPEIYHFSKALRDYLEFLLLKTSHQPEAGLGLRYPCSCAIVNISVILQDLNVPLLKALLTRDCHVTLADIQEGVKCLKKNQSDLLEVLLASYNSRQKEKKNILKLTKICTEIIGSKKLNFVSLLVKYGATPSADNILECTDFSKLDSILVQYVTTTCSPERRTKLLFDILQSGSSTKEEIEGILISGEILPDQVNLSTIITSPFLVQNHDILVTLFNYGVSASSSITSSSTTTTTVMSTVFRSKTLSRLQQAQLAELLVYHGAKLDDLSVAYSEPLGPLHIAIKLALETGHVDIVEAVCSRSTFENRGKLIDRNTQTPYHYAMRAKHTDRSIKVCEILSKYPIDPYVKDRWGKIAQDYCRAKGDKRVPYLNKAARLMEEKNSESSTAGTAANDQKSKKKKKKKKKEKIEEKEVNLDNDDAVDIVPTTNEEDIVSVPDNRAVEKSTLIAETQTPDLSTLILFLCEQSDHYFDQTGIDPYETTTTYNKQVSDSSQIDAAFFEDVVMEDEGEMEYTTSAVLNKSHFEDQPWEVECTDKVIQFLKDQHYPAALKVAMVHKIHFLASGHWPKTLAMHISSIDQVLFQTKLTRSLWIIWEVAVQFSSRCTDKAFIDSKKSMDNQVGHIYSEMIRIWDIVLDGEPKIHSLENIQKSYKRGVYAHINFALLPQIIHHSSLPDVLTSEHLPRRFLLHPSQNPTYDHECKMTKFIPAASVKEDEFNVITFYSFTSALVYSMLQGENVRRDYPFKEWPKEHDIIYRLPNSEAILLLGRSGTGKTTCCLYRLWNHFSDYWKQAVTIGSWYPCRPLPLVGVISTVDKEQDLDDEIDGDIASDDSSQFSSMLTSTSISESVIDEPISHDLEDLHQVFLTKNYVLCAQMKKRFYDMSASHDFLSDHMTYENTPCPLSLMSAHNKAFPLFLTSRQFLLLLDNSLNVGKPFFPRTKDGNLAVKISSSDYDHEDPDTLLDLEESDDENEIQNEGDQQHHNQANPIIVKQQSQIWKEVTAAYFVSEIWPKISQHCIDKNMDPLLVWMEIKSFIKGSLKAVENKEGFLSSTEYQVLGRKMASNFAGNREEIYQLFQRYEDYKHRKRNLNLFDETDLVHHIYQRLVQVDNDLPWSVHHFYIDEVQDFTQAELSLILRCCREPNGLFMTGDTAQSIMRGISFRFNDLRSLFHRASKQSLCSLHPSRISVPQLHELTINFRSHSGILQLATSVIELLKEYFPCSFDRLPEDHGMFPGPQPVFLQSCQVSDLALLLQSNKRVSSSIEFGAHQVIIVQTDEAKRSLPEVLRAGIVLTVFEAKGLEFDDVLLYNFFTDSSIDKDWRVVTTFADKTFPISTDNTLESKPRPLEFDERLHKSLNSELKYLYTAITRAKCNLWIYDSSESCRLPMLDYWMRYGLVRVVRVGEREEDDRVLFTATSTPEQWHMQGDYFRKKGLWEPAIKCYHKAGDTLSEKEAEAYLFAQKARQSKIPREIQEWFEKAALAFLTCDYKSHDVKYLVSAAKCLKNARKYFEAAKLFERLGQSELAKRGYLRAKDHNNLSRLKEAEGDYSGAVRVFVRANKRLEALEKAKHYEKKGRHLDTDVGSFQLANLYAKYYISRHEDNHLKKVIQYIPNVMMKVAHLKKARLYDLAIDEYIQAGHYKDAERLMSAQEMFSRGVKLAKSTGKIALESSFLLQNVVATIYHKIKMEDDLKESLVKLTKSSILPVQAKAYLLSGMVQGKSTMCREAVRMYNETTVNSVGAAESFNHLVSLKKDVTYTVVVAQCFEARALANSFRSTVKSPTRSQNIQYALEFYHLNKLESVYLLPRSQDIWVGCLKTAVCRDQETDENGMLRLDPVKVHNILADRFNKFWTEWLNETEVEKRVLSRLASYPFHKEVIEKGYLVRHLQGYPPNLIKEYIQAISIAMQVRQLNTKYFKGANLEGIPLRIFSPRVSLCLPLSKTFCMLIRRSEAVGQILKKTLSGYIGYSALKRPHVDELFKAWYCQALIDGNGSKLETDLENFAAKEGPGGQPQTKNWLVIDRRQGKEVYHHFFAFWLKSCRIIREEYHVLEAMKILYTWFFTVIARRSTLRKTLSVMNCTYSITLYTTALIGLISVAQPNSGVVVPLFYKYQAQLFDDINIQGPQQYWLLSACVAQVGQRQKEQRSDRLVDEASDFLFKILTVCLGGYNDQFNILKYALSSAGSAREDGSLVHCLVCILVLIANLKILRPIDKAELNDMFTLVQMLVNDETLSTNDSSKKPSYLSAVNDKLQSASIVADLFEIVQQLLSSGNFPNSLARLQPAKSGNMDFKEISIPSHCFGIRLKSMDSSPVKDPSLSIKQPADVVTPPTSELPSSSVQPPPSLPTMHVDSSAAYLQQQWIFIMQRLEELQHYQGAIQQQLTQLQMLPQNILTQTQQQQLTFLTQQFYQVIQAQQQYKLQQEHIQQQYQLALLTSSGQLSMPSTAAVSNIPPSTTALSLEPQGVASSTVGASVQQPNTLSTSSAGQVVYYDDNDDDFNMTIDDEIEKILGSFLSQPQEQEEPDKDALTDDITLTEVDSELVDEHYCQACGISLHKERHNTLLDEDDEDTYLSTNTDAPSYKQHITTQTHRDNLFAYKKYMAVKSGHYTLLRTQLNEALNDAKSLQTVAEIDALLFEIPTELLRFDELLEECVNSHNWKQAHGHLVASLDVLQSYATRLAQTCAKVQFEEPTHNGGTPPDVLLENEGEIDVEEIEMTEEFENSNLTKEKSRNKKRQKKMKGRP